MTPEQTAGRIPPCNDCGQPATEQVANGHTRRGGRWHRHYLWLCGECAAEFRVERKAARAS